MVKDKNKKLQDIKFRFIDMCQDKGVYWTDALLYMIFSEYPIAIIDEQCGDLNEIKRNLNNEYNEIWDMQPAIEEDEEKAFLIQHIRDVYDVLLQNEEDKKDEKQKI